MTEIHFKWLNKATNICLHHEEADTGVVLHACLNPFIPSASFLYPLKTSENLKVF